MTLFQLECFISCASLYSFNKAAKVNYTSPSTVTRQIAALENELGVRLLERDTHKVTVTEEGNLFFRCVHSIMGQMTQWRENLIAIGKLPPEEPCLRIASYTSDSMYRKLADLIQVFPADWLSKPIKFVFPTEGRMIETVLEGGAQIGIDSAEMVKAHGDVFETHLLHRSTFHLLVGRYHPLHGRESISLAELLSQYGNYGAFLPPGIGGSLAYAGLPLRTGEDLRILGEFTIAHLPQILPLLGRVGRESPPMDHMMLLAPTALELFDFVNFHPIRLEDDRITTDYVLFWRRGEADPELSKFLEMVDYDYAADSRK